MPHTQRRGSKYRSATLEIGRYFEVPPRFLGLIRSLRCFGGRVRPTICWHTVETRIDWGF